MWCYIVVLEVTDLFSRHVIYSVVHFVVEHRFAGALLNNLRAEHLLTIVLELQCVFHINVLKALRDVSSFYLHGKIERVSD